MGTEIVESHLSPALYGKNSLLYRETYAEEMPFRSPHTAAPCLWAIRDADGPSLEFSATTPPVARDEQDRKGLEAALIAVHRREVGQSPTANFARIIEGYLSPNDNFETALVILDRRDRGDSKRSVANSAGVSRRTVGRIEHRREIYENHGDSGD